MTKDVVLVENYLGHLSSLVAQVAHSIYGLVVEGRKGLAKSRF